MSIKTILSISRPRFWLYLAGPYLVGYMFGTQNIFPLQSYFFLLNFLFFLIPANIFLYGVNDLFDEDTDKFNQKKGEYEHKLVSNEKNNLMAVSLFALSSGFFLLALQPQMEVQLLFVLFLFLSYFYSAPPLRFKSKPFIDFSSNILYAIPGLIGYYQTTSALPSFPILVGLLTWTSSMHLFSAIPDIAADKKANLRTSAVMLGKTNSLILCLILWSVTAVLTIWQLNSYFALLVILYPFIPLYILFQKNVKIKKIYKLFPLLNTAAGFLLFLHAVL